ncbi:MAG: hypothetical protein Q7S22_08820 [Candidatus Micrarchaeota archaeon]|nr:hypothetical protein [Candidatus Micrarchaeota archaeon]
MKRCVILLLAVLLFFGCTGNSELSGKWRILSNTRYVSTDGYYSAPTQLLEINGQSWTFGSSSGTWEIQPIDENDWIKWETTSYGPTRKIVVHNWNGADWSGPIEESNGKIDFFWIIYNVDIGSGPQQVQMKFGQSSY